MNNKENFDEPLIFLKSNTSLISDNNEIIYPKFVSKIWIEADLCLIIGKEGKHLEEKGAKKYILGHTWGNDVTAANIINRDWHLARSSMNTFAPIGPYLIKDLKGDDLEIKSSINGNISQKSRTSDRVLNDNQCISLISKYFTLYPGDIIFTGTPADTDAIVKSGDSVEIEIEKIGKLKIKLYRNASSYCYSS